MDDDVHNKHTQLRYFIKINMESNSSPMRVALVTGGVTRADGVRTRRKLTTIVDYIMADLHRSPTLEQMAALVSLSTYHFARQFEAATGVV